MNDRGNRSHRTRSTTGPSQSTSTRLAPGKRALTDALPIQRRRDPARNVSADALRPSGEGSPLPEAIQAKMEASFGTAFGGVRVHVGDEAPSIGAVAFTQGPNIHFAPGAYDPHSASGQALLGHELAHVVQQRAGRVDVPVQAHGAPINADAGLEAEADAAGARAARGEPAGIAVSGGAAAAGGAIQRAVGFEFEFGHWRSSRGTGEGRQRLAKGESIETVDGAFQIQGEDIAGEDSESAVEFVTEPAATAADIVRIVGSAATRANALLNAPNPTTVGDVDIERLPGGATAQMQVSPAIALSAIPRLYQSSTPEMGSGTRYTISQFIARSVDTRVDDPAFRNEYLGGGTASEQLTGFLVLLVDYLRQGAGTSQARNYPKEVIALMARTSFDHMFAMLPEQAMLGQDRERWVGMVLDVFASTFSSAMDTGGDAPVLGQQFLDIDPVPARPDGPTTRDEQLTTSAPAGPGTPGHYRLNLTRAEWLRHMPDRDLLSHATDRRFEGMGKLGAATDKAAQVGAQVGGLLAPALDDAVDDAVDGHDDGAGPSTAVATAPAQPASADAEAPLFELRGANDMFGVKKQVAPGEWLDEARAIFATIDAANGQTYRPDPNPLARTGGPGESKPYLWDRVPTPEPTPTQTRPAARRRRRRPLRQLVQRLELVGNLFLGLFRRR